MTDEANPTAETAAAGAAAPPGDGDVLKKVAGAMMTAAEAMKAGAGDAQSAAARALPAAKQIVSKSIYATCYYVSYGVVFPTLLVAGLFPKNNPLYFGMVDGAHAAQDMVEHMHERRKAMKRTAEEVRQQAAEMQAAAAAAPA